MPRDGASPLRGLFASWREKNPSEFVYLFASPNPSVGLGRRLAGENIDPAAPSECANSCFDVAVTESHLLGDLTVRPSALATRTLDEKEQHRTLARQPLRRARARLESRRHRVIVATVDALSQKREPEEER